MCVSVLYFLIFAGLLAALCLIATCLGVRETFLSDSATFAESFIGWVVPLAVAALGGLVVFSVAPPEDAPCKFTGSPPLLVVRSILTDCGVTTDSSAGGEDETAPLV